MIKRNLYRPTVGQVVNLKEGQFRVVKVGPPLSAYLGGRNVAPATLEPYKPPVDPHGTDYGHQDYFPIR